MQVILTHEQADFDAIASLLGASLLQVGSKPVLPLALNRNVKAFVHLYAAELPFISQDDLPKEPIQTITIVDTQSLITLKGMKKDTSVYVIDHHQKKPDFPSAWNFSSVPTGACTTYFVEHLQEVNGHLSLVHATLLLTGIYEDTGSLTYANTTSRDVMAVAYLLDQGASLKIATDFLNPPLSLQQREVFELLIDHIRTYTIHDCKVFISHAAAPLLEDEVSSIAHKISDLYDPDALFVFVETREGIRLVARSVNEQINVSEISKLFGGGGHERAAAALIKRDKKRKNQLEEIVNNFEKELTMYIQPAITVKQIMSKKPLLISPDTTAQEALKLMQKFGYEGYPVVDNGQVVGLLTRRAVDRALSHKLNLPASSLMDAGSISVNPGDSLDYLQRLMADSGWGQVPVLDSKSGKISGIVTRTDLLNTIAGRSVGRLERRNLAAELEECLPPANMGLLNVISMIASELQLPIYLVGGFARDLLLESPSLDLDFVVEGDAIQLAQSLSKKYGGKVTSHRKFGTSKWHLENIRKDLIDHNDDQSVFDFNTLPMTVDLVSARTEFYEKPTALPTVVRGSIKLDLHRRDFTINTMAIRLDGYHFGELYDYWGGLSDLKKKKVRVLHSLSFVDDPTRILRAVRFEKRFNFSIEKRTLELLHQARNLLLDVSGDRIRHELDQIFKESQAPEILSRMEELDLFQPIHPEIAWTEKLEKELKSFQSKVPDENWRFSDKDRKELTLYSAYIIMFSRLETSSVLNICKRLRIKNHLRKNILDANLLWKKLNKFVEKKPSEIASILEDYSQMVIYSVHQLCDKKDQKITLHQFATHWRWIEPLTDGEKLKEIGLEPGPVFKGILGDLKAAWINGDIKNEKEEKIKLKELLKKYQTTA
jgi:tRNA nucleotidyltransferase (CCA-adding enzyme)